MSNKIDLETTVVPGEMFSYKRSVPLSAVQCSGCHSTELKLYSFHNGCWRRRRLLSSVTRRVYNITHQRTACDGGPVMLRPIRAPPWYSFELMKTCLLFVSYRRWLHWRMTRRRRENFRVSWISWRNVPQNWISAGLTTSVQSGGPHAGHIILSDVRVRVFQNFMQCLWSYIKTDFLSTSVLCTEMYSLKHSSQVLRNDLCHCWHNHYTPV